MPLDIVCICVDKPQYVYCLNIPDDVMGIVDTVTTCCLLYKIIKPYFTTPGM